ncbi:MAG: hypothetical protein C0403_11155 [Desulfobacterium sp.]|nr:hypothetical protein [Desulfobacterium sp.]
MLHQLWKNSENLKVIHEEVNINHGSFQSWQSRECFFFDALINGLKFLHVIFGFDISCFFYYNF